MSPSAAPPAPPPVPLAEVAASDAPSAAAPGMPEAERRQLTMLVCRLVGVPEHAKPGDCEARLAVVRDYQAMCTEIIQRFGGHMAQSQGERLLVYFGYPQAHEDDARRAVHAGLGMVEGMVALDERRPRDWGVRLAVRVGIHTGVGWWGRGTGDPRSIARRGRDPHHRRRAARAWPRPTRW